MARLIVAACSQEFNLGTTEGVYLLHVGVSVSRADDGKPVTGLKAENCRVSATTGSYTNFNVIDVGEWKWEPADVEPAGCYLVAINVGYPGEFLKGQRYVFGIQARTFGLPSFGTPRGDTLLGGGPRPVIDQGQTVFLIALS